MSFRLKCAFCEEWLSLASAKKYVFRHILDEMNSFPPEWRAEIARCYCPHCGYGDGEHAEDCDCP